jgi:hypothetical protein
MRVAQFRVLPAGHAVRVGADLCATVGQGITCLNTRTHHGFTLDRDSYRLI